MIDPSGTRNTGPFDARLTRDGAPYLAFTHEPLGARLAAALERLIPTVDAALRAEAFWAPLNCDIAADAYGTALAAEGFTVERVSGLYLDDEGWTRVTAGGDPPGLAEHTWLRVDGVLVDPTAAQFGATELSCYREESRSAIP